ncbi:hypothetical protein BDBG_08687 [Blastomyces gilchristii SLH14081]|uniref:Uncharacterized protein n=1 Tax=Blastomyces gilchristii (strain SLH14081) TaxID=559298 RepID=A0A179UZI6_BLAGS|nr:uncharacterized protein BDBG_08687 [Blastomyces gilchristii SLH14081]OAT13494.1 hypothetical protein BDBG_08687 [Blastomyces gilchristii SLH14081]
MARAFSSTARTLVRSLGYDKELLTPEFQQALDLIRHRNDGTLGSSTNGPAPAHHIYENGTGTIRLGGDKREYSTSATQGEPVTWLLKRDLGSRTWFTGAKFVGGYSEMPPVGSPVVVLAVMPYVTGS